MKKILLGLFLLSPLLSQAQKVNYDKKTNVVTVDGVKSFNIVRDGCGFMEAECFFDVMDNEGKREIRITYKTFKDMRTADKSNPEGTIGYGEFVFFATKQKAQTRLFYTKADKMAEFVAKNKLFANGKLDPKAVDDFVLVYGMSIKPECN